MKREPLPPVDDYEQLAGGPMAEKGTGPASEYGGEPPAFPGDLRMPDREDAAVEPMKVSLADQPRDLRRAQPRGCELKTGDHSVLTRGQ